MKKKRRIKLFHAIVLVVLYVAVLNNCASQPSEIATLPSHTSRLRIVNNGNLEIKNLIVIFPRDRIEFGDIPAGATTKYKDVLNGIFAYAAYNFDFNGKTLSQDIIDWMGELPMSGEIFTYVIDFDPSRRDFNDSIRLIEIKRDE